MGSEMCIRDRCVFFCFFLFRIDGANRLTNERTRVVSVKKTSNDFSLDSSWGPGVVFVCVCVCVYVCVCVCYDFLLPFWRPSPLRETRPCAVGFCVVYVSTQWKHASTEVSHLPVLRRNRRSVPFFCFPPLAALFRPAGSRECSCGFRTRR